MTHIRKPRKFFLWAALMLITAIAAGVSYYTSLSFLWAYLTGVNVIALLFYGYDKQRAVAMGGRIPEMVLHLLALAGGSIGAFAGQMIFRHKIRKLKFMLVFAAIVATQIAVAVLVIKH